jgi:hypothetical protein
MCHKGKRTIKVSAAAVQAHLDHGDTLGACDKKNRHSKKDKHRGDGDRDHGDRRDKDRDDDKDRHDDKDHDDHKDWARRD